MKSKVIFLLLSLFEYSCLFAQNNNFQFGTPVETGYRKLGAIKGAAGIIGDNYYVLENDFGGRFDFNNNIRTVVTCLSTRDGKLKNRFNLNELIANSRKDVNQILFCDVVTWKDKIVGFYTYKNPSGKNFLASAMTCDQNGKLLKDKIEIGDFNHNYVNGSFLWQGGLLVNGRNTLSVVKDFQYRFTPDSSRIIVLCSPSEGSGNVRFKTYDSNLAEQKEIIATIPLAGKSAAMVDFGMDNNGNVYIITKNNVGGSYYDLHTVNTGNNNKVTTVSLDVAGARINNCELILKSDNQVYCFGNYWDTENERSRGNLVGLFSVHVNNSDKPGQVTRNRYDLPDSVLKNLGGKVKKGEGLRASFGSYQAIPDNNGGMYVIIAEELTETTVRGATGAMNTVTEITEAYIMSYITPEKKIKWASGFGYESGNLEMMTRIGRACFFEKDHSLYITFIADHAIKKEKKSFYVASFDKENGSFMPSLRILEPLEGQNKSFNSVERTVLPAGNNEFDILLLGDRLSLARFNVE